MKVNLKYIEEDEFNDDSQNENAYEGGVSGQKELLHLFGTTLKPDYLDQKILDVGCGGGELFNLLPITHAIEPNHNRFRTARKKEQAKVKHGWAEDLPYDEKQFNLVICWGTLCFVESLVQTIVQANRVLKIGGHYIFDIVTFTTMPLAQTVHPYSFQGFIKMFGFEIEAMLPFGESYHKRVGYLVIKTDDYNHRKLLMPQVVGGKVNNYLEERDWFLK